MRSINHKKPFLRQSGQKDSKYTFQYLKVRKYKGLKIHSEIPTMFTELIQAKKHDSLRSINDLKV